MRISLLTLLLALCSVSTAIAGAWTQPRNTLWLKLASSTQHAENLYAPTDAVLANGMPIEAGGLRPFDDDGFTRISGVYLDLEFGVTDRLTLGVQAPWKDLRFEDEFQITHSFGWGDPRVSLRMAILQSDHRLSLRGAAKLPWGRFSTEPGRIPIGENQTDLELGLQWGHSLGRPMSWLGVEAHRRFRLRDDELDHDPSDEWFGSAELGTGFDDAGRLGMKLSWMSVRGDETSLNFFAPGFDLARDFDQFAMMGMFDAHWAFIEMGGQRTMASRGYPAGWEFVVGVSRSIQLDSVLGSALNGGTR